MKKLLPNVASASTIRRKKAPAPEGGAKSSQTVPKWPMNTNSIAMPRNASTCTKRPGRCDGAEFSAVGRAFDMRTVIGSAGHASGPACLNGGAANTIKNFQDE